MNTKIVSTSQSPFNNLCPKPLISQFQSLPSRVSFNTPNISIKTSTRPFRFRPIAAVNYTTAPSPATESFYDLLGVPESGSISEIKGAYKRLALKYHPDVSPPERTEEYTRKFIRVQEAYQTLSDQKSRAMYDSDMAKGFNLDFSGRKGVRFDPRSEEMDVWKSMWQSQIMELKKKSVMNSTVGSRGRVTWGARIRNRKQRSESFSNGFN